jgi:hypothetical protein
MRERERLDMNYSIEKTYIINLAAVAVAVAVAAGFSQLTDTPTSETRQASFTSLRRQT